MPQNGESSRITSFGAVVRNPLSVIAMFVLLVETIATVTLTKVLSFEAVSIPLAWFSVLFPTLIAAFFFATIWWKHQFLYSPMEYRSDEAFLTAMERLQRVEARQEAADLNPRTASELESINVVNRLLELDDIKSAVKVGRTFLENNQYDIAHRIFQHILDKAPVDHRDRFNALANLGYSSIGIGDYGGAISALEDCLKTAGKNSGPWHFLALAYAYFKLSCSKPDLNYKKFEEYLSISKNHPWFAYNKAFFKSLYPEIANKL